MRCPGWLTSQENPIQVETTIWIIFLLVQSLIKGFINRKDQNNIWMQHVEPAL